MSTMRIALLWTATCLLSCGEMSTAVTDASGTSPDGDSVISCPATIDAYCSQHDCLRSWADVPKCGRTILSCGTYWAVQGNRPTEGGLDFYDKTSGQLVAVTAGAGCLAGPTSFAEPDTNDCISNGPGVCDGGM